MAVRDDAPSVGRHDDEHLRRFLAARKAGDVAQMRAWWEELVIDFADRMDGLVAVTHRGRLDRLEHEEAVQRALTKFSEGLVHTFRGTSMGELVNATKTLCHYVCIDVQKEAERRRRPLRSLDEGWDAASDEDGPAPTWEVDAAREAFARAESAANVEDFLGWALPQLLDTRRAVVERSLAGVPIPEICAELGIEENNAHQRRSRGLKDLGKLYEQYGS